MASLRSGSGTTARVPSEAPTARNWPSMETPRAFGALSHLMRVSRGSAFLAAPMAVRLISKVWTPRSAHAARSVTAAPLVIDAGASMRSWQTDSMRMDGHASREATSPAAPLAGVTRRSLRSERATQTSPLAVQHIAVGDDGRVKDGRRTGSVALRGRRKRAREKVAIDSVCTCLTTQSEL